MIKATPPIHRASNIFRCGDIFEHAISIESNEYVPYLRTNLGGSMKFAASQVKKVDQASKYIANNNWIDIKLRAKNNNLYSIILPLLEVGHFEANIWLQHKTTNKIIWPSNDNIIIKVEPASTITNNSIYGAFTRMFGPNKNKDIALENDKKAINLTDNEKYHVIPKSGTFRDLKNELDHIMNDMGFSTIQLLPIHPTPITYGRMGQFGSPYAALDFFAIDPALAEFDKKASPLDQFKELLDDIHSRNGELYLDIPVDHTGWASTLQQEKPEYFMRQEDGEFISPGAWGTIWEDLIKLDFSKKEVIQMMADVFLFWCNIGVDGFRCDAGYMLPYEAWEYIIAKVRQEYPNTIFLLEGLGGPPEVTEHYLSKATFSWAYSELFQNYSKDEVTHYLKNMLHISSTKGGLVNFSETHDNSRLANTSTNWSIMRNLLCALTAPAGAYGISNGVEYFATEQISVHGASGLNWGNANHMKELLHSINTIYKTHPAFWSDAHIEIIDNTTPSLIICKRTSANEDIIYNIINLNCEHTVSLDLTSYFKEKTAYDLLSKTPFTTSAEINAGHALCLTDNKYYLSLTSPYETHPRLNEQHAKQMLFETNEHIKGFGAISENFVQDNLDKYITDPMEWCTNMGFSFAKIIMWDVKTDPKRIVMAISGGILILHNKNNFSFKLKIKEFNINSGIAIKNKEQGYFAVIPLKENRDSKPLEITINTFDHQSKSHQEGIVHILPHNPAQELTQQFDIKTTIDKKLYALLTNSSGSMSQTSGVWGQYNSKYDGLFIANLDANVPIDRTTMLSRCRTWVVYNDYSFELDKTTQYQFAADGSSQAEWYFEVPTGNSTCIKLCITLIRDKCKELAQLSFKRLTQDTTITEVDQVKVIVRPDIEYRSHHETTKAFQGLENLFPEAVSCVENGFSFQPNTEIPLNLHINEGSFTWEPEWQYMHKLPTEEERSLESSTDLFSPGFFSFNLSEKEEKSIHISAGKDMECKSTKKSTPLAPKIDLNTTLKQAMDQFIVKRNEGKTVLAGYPWFLDWGRDTLIALRGIISSGQQKESKEIIHTFAQFEEKGTLPNMIRGNNASNRETSDAPLWFFVAVSDYIQAFDDEDILKMDCDGRQLLSVMESLVENYIKGTSNGIQVDKASGLVYSPSHYTWMDTNYPAGSPREGYPIEIQALWYFAVNFLHKITGKEDYDSLAQKTQNSIVKHYPLKNKEGFADCLHTNGYKPVTDAKKDNLTRPNQLFLITLQVIRETKLIISILKATQRLIIPGGIRSLDDAEASLPLPIYNNGQLLNNPTFPYWGHYSGDEDTRRKPAYHNGTAWAWPFFSYAEALYLYTKDRKSALDIIMSSNQVMESGIINHLPEIYDGNSPHISKGCGAQAWSISEYYRIINQLS